MPEMLRMIREQQPTKPSAKLSTAEGSPNFAANRGTEPATPTKLVRGELDWIVRKAPEKDRNCRPYLRAAPPLRSKFKTFEPGRTSPNRPLLELNCSGITDTSS